MDYEPETTRSFAGSAQSEQGGRLPHIEGIDSISRAVILFSLYSCAGWLYETIENVFTFGGVYLRAQLMLPWCPIYGIGGLLIVAALEPLRRKLAGRIPLFLQVAAIAIGIYVVATVVELAGSYVCEWIMGYVPWDYSHAWGNFQGRIAPIYSMRFVVLGLIALYVLYPAITRLVAAKPHAARIVAVILLAALIGDYALEFAGVWVGVKDGLTIFGINHW
ncbi:MAG: putative ABC transporter permease [Eggerthellaceae bacterium]|nr:putative ABC transporter permease [Eggerthellaceae bacterium]